LENYGFLGGPRRHRMGARNLQSRVYSLLGVHLPSLVAATWALAACGYSQQLALPAAPSKMPSKAARELTFLPVDGSWAVSSPEKGEFQNAALSSLQWKFDFKQQESAADRYRFTPFACRGAARRTCPPCISSLLPKGDSVRGENYDLFECDGLGYGSPQKENQDSPPASQKQTPSAEAGSPKHIFFIVPAFHVSYLTQFKPLTPREKFDEWAHGTYDPRGLLLYAGEAATLEHSSRDGYCGYGKSFGRYAECFGSMELDANISSFFGDFLFPMALHQDPRYFRRGTGSLGARAAYALSRVFVTHADSGRMVFFSSAVAGSLLAAAASNLYFPARDRGVEPSLQRLAIDFGDTALFNVAAEFWPDINQTVQRVLAKF
jgi:hypothetical protein